MRRSVATASELSTPSAFGDVTALSWHPGVENAASTQSGRAYASIRRRILALELPPGAALSEKALIQDVGLGRTPVREALLRLSVERLVTSQPGGGFQVATLGIEDVRDIYEVRLQEDRLAGRLCLQNAGPDHLDRIARCFEAAGGRIADGDWPSVFDMDFRFHALFYGGAGNAVLAANHHLLVGHYYRIARIVADRRREALTHAGMRDLVRSHDAMIAAVRALDGPALDRAITEHTAASLLGAVQAMTGLRMTSLTDLVVTTLRETYER